ncbi:type VII secretion protein EccB [Vallicoccus soli]|uniref:type VII secretion protein EccB n=1 Tax=Vallicoccus soli TaxID=2339232 RepID=UPI001059B0D1|nr:type VII secretion protein EccB [Vallicoccus soli]
MASRRVLIDAEDFARRRGVAALLRGDSLDVEEVPRRPNAALAAGVVLALLAAAATAGTAFVTGREPSGWQRDGTLVLDRETGARFLAEDGRLRPAPTLTSVLLAGGRTDPVLVPHDAVAAAPLGAALGGAGLPEAPPGLPERPTGFTACLTAPAAVDVHAGAPGGAPADATGLLVRTPGSTQLVLLAGARAHPVAGDALAPLGLFPAQVREVPAAWLALVPSGPALRPLAVPPEPAGQGVRGVGQGGEVVASRGTGRAYLVSRGTVRPFLDRTSELLAPRPVRAVPDAALEAAPEGPPVGVPGAPAEPPAVPDPSTPVVPCTRSSDGQLSLLRSAQDRGTRPSTPREAPTDPPVTVRWHLAPGQGALVGPPDLDAPPPAGTSARGSGGIRLVADGLAHEVADLDALRALGYRREQTVLLPGAWLALAPTGAVVETQG